jgi:hypothetical protein
MAVIASIGAVRSLGTFTTILTDSARLYIDSEGKGRGYLPKSR